MTFRETLEKLTGSRYCCAAGCCGAGCGQPERDPEALDFNLALMLRLVAACIAFAVALLVRSLPQPWSLVLLIASALIAGCDILAAAVLRVTGGRFLDKSVLMSLAVILAIAFGARVEGAALVLLYQLGGVFIDYACTRTRFSVLEAVSCDAATARVQRDAGEELLPAEDVEVGDRIIVEAGERVPCDCIVLEGASSLDRSALGDTSGPVLAREGDELLSGSLNQTGRLRCEVTARQADSAAAGLSAAVTRGAAAGAVLPEALSRFLQLYPAVLVVLAVLAAGLLPFALDISVGEAVQRAAALLVLANPCAVAIAIPLIRLSAMGGAAKAGILFSDCGALDAVSVAGTLAFDQAGTLTEGSPRVVAVKSARMEPEVLLKVAAHALAYANTPEARSIIAAYGGTIYIDLVENFLEIPNGGVEVQVDKVRICVGSRDLMLVKGVSVPDEDISEDASVYVSIAGAYAGRILLRDALRGDAAAGVRELGEKGVDSVLLFTADSRDAAARTASELGIVEYYAEQDRAKLRAALEAMQGGIPGRTLVLVEGQDAAGGAHSAADVDVAMTGLEALTMPTGADVQILGGRVTRLPLAIGIAKYALMLTWASASAALVVKLLLAVLAVLGIAPVWFVAFIDACAAVAAALVSILAFTGELNGRRRAAGE